jgi:aminomethyltransferase
MKSTPLTDKHISLGAKMAEFAGYNMPISYVGIKEEHHTVRNNVGVFDVSHMGEFIVKGKQAMELIQKVTSNDVSKLEIGDAQYSCLPNHEGGIIDDLLVYRLDEDQCSDGEKAFMLVVNASNIDKDWNWISKHNNFDAKMTNISDNCGLLAVQGPKAVELLQTMTDINLAEIEYYKFKKGTMGGIPNVLISATGYTGAGGFELYVENKDMLNLWNQLFEAGEPFDLKPIGLGARDTLRLEMGFCLYGNDIDDTTSPIEAGLRWITKINKGEFNSNTIFANQIADGVGRKLVGFELKDRRVPRHGYSIEDASGQLIGEVTSGTQSPTLDKPIGMGYVVAHESKAGNTIYININDKKFEATIVKVPFLQKN